MSDLDQTKKAADEPDKPAQSDSSSSDPSAHGLSNHRISRHKQARLKTPRRRAVRSRRPRQNYSPGKVVALVSAFLAAIIIAKVILFPGDRNKLEVTQLAEQDSNRSVESKIVSTKPKGLLLKAEDFSGSLSFAAGQNDFPVRRDILVQGHEFELQLVYTINEDLQLALTDWLDRYDPDFAVAVAIDPDTGKILALTTHVSDGEPMGNLAMSSAFPAASVFKIITAAAAMDLGKLDPKSVIPFNGKSTSLYKKNVFEHKNTKWTRKPTLGEAFAKSINTVFGRIGLYTVGAAQLNSYADRFQFNTKINTDIPIDPSQTYIPAQDDWAVVEAASGYTNKVTLSPLHGAAVAASMINGGKLMRPYMVERAYDKKDRLVYKGSPQNLALAITPETARNMQKLMSKTVSMGTARRSFGDFFKGQYADVHVGGKTGTLSGGTLKGLNDWFVGYAYTDNRKLAFAVLNINLDKWKVKSHYLSRLMIEHYFDQTADVKLTAGQ